MRSLLTTATLAGGLLLAAQAGAAPMLWQNNSLTYLYGKDFKVDPDTQHTLTFEHASGWTYGDVFLFVDYKWNESQDNSDAARTYYGEFSPRLSLSKTTGTDLSFGPVTDVLIGFTYERGEDRVQNYLLGPAVDLAVPGFDRLAINTYYRKPDGIRNKASGQWQITPTWAITIPVGSSDILFDGYIDWVVNDAGNKDSDDYQSKNLHINPQIKYDLGKAVYQKAGQLYVGIEYDYWSNKYGIKDGGFVSKNFVGSTDQSAWNAIVKVHF